MAPAKRLLRWRSGYRVTAVELGPQLAAIARRKLSVYPGVEAINADFETRRAPRAGFDAVVSFTAFHWIDPAVRFAKSAALLRENGALAIADGARAAGAKISDVATRCRAATSGT